MIDRRRFMQLGATAGAWLSGVLAMPRGARAAIPGGTLDPAAIPKYQVPLPIPAAMPQSDRIDAATKKHVDYYEIAVREFRQQILPPGMPDTTVWGYGAI